MQVPINFILLIPVVAFWIWGFEYAFQSGEILGAPGDWIRRTWPDWAISPTIGCIKCMASVHGTAWYLLFFAHQYNFFHHILFVVAICGFNAFTDRLSYIDEE